LSVPELLACDWGSTHLRAWTLAGDGELLDHAAFDLGVNKLAPGEAERRFNTEVRPCLAADGLPALLCGAIGSNVGWRTVPYVDCPANLASIAAGVTEIAPGVSITPGIRCQGPIGVDVLRGEETKALGWLWHDAARRRGRVLICEPGTHPKWLVAEHGVIVRFLSALTGELFDVLSHHSILRSDGATHDLALFDEGLAAAGDGDALLNRIYSARSRVAGAGAPQASTGSYLSGVLIGAETGSTPRLLGLEGEPVVLLADDPLRALYRRALVRRGVNVTLADAEPAVLAGLIAIARVRGMLR
jgi:2-dehydro-3-deoxygalactonokinase